MYKPPKTFPEAENLINSGTLREQIVKKLILLAFGENSTVALKACIELLAMPMPKKKEFLEGMSTEELELAEKLLPEMERELYEAIHSQ